MWVLLFDQISSQVISSITAFVGDIYHYLPNDLQQPHSRPSARIIGNIIYIYIYLYLYICTDIFGYIHGGLKPFTEPCYLRIARILLPLGGCEVRRHSQWPCSHQQGWGDLVG